MTRLFKSSLAHRDFRYFSNLQQLEDENISNCEKFREDFKVRFENLEKIHVPNWSVIQFDLEVGNADIESHFIYAVSCWRF